MNNIEIGKKGEKLAQEYLVKNRYKIIDTNKRFSRFCEIDIIALEKDTLVFCEVKTRKTNICGSPFEAITKSKYQNIKKGVFYYLSDLSDQKSAFNKQLQSKAKSVLIVGNVSKVDSKVSHTKIEASVTVDINIGVSQVKEYLTGTPLQYQITANAPVHNPAEFARGYMAIGETLDGVKGVDAIKQKLKDLLKVKQ